MTKSNLTRKTHQTVDEILATMTPAEIENMTDAQMAEIAEQVADTVTGPEIPDVIGVFACHCDRPMPASDGECQRCFGFIR